jgi:hypothetical protein
MRAELAEQLAADIEKTVEDIKRSPKEVAGPYRAFRNSQDYDLWLCALTAGARIGVVNQPLMNYRVRNSSNSKGNPFETAVADAYAQLLYKERVKSDGKDSFSMVNQGKFFGNNGVDDAKYATSVNRRLRNFDRTKERVIKAKGPVKVLQLLHLLAVTFSSTWVLKLQLDNIKFRLKVRSSAKPAKKSAPADKPKTHKKGGVHLG